MEDELYSDNEQGSDEEKEEDNEPPMGTLLSCDGNEYSTHPGRFVIPRVPTERSEMVLTREDRFRPFRVHVVLSHLLSHAPSWGRFR
jgi:hypothetical protein